MDAKLLNDSIVMARKILRGKSPDALVGRDCLAELVEAAAKWVDSQVEPKPPITIYIESGLVQHVQCADPSQPVVIIDLDTEGTPACDLQPLTGGEILGLPDGLEARGGKAFVRVWQNGEAVPRE
jgi:hypothetical protein